MKIDYDQVQDAASVGIRPSRRRGRTTWDRRNADSPSTPFAKEAGAERAGLQTLAALPPIIRH